MKLQVLDNGYVEHIESWGHGMGGVNLNAEDGMSDTPIDDNECAIIEAARQSTQGSFRGWNWHCNECGQNFEQKKEHTTTVDLPGIRMTGAICNSEKGWSNDEKLLAFMYNNKHSTPFEFAGMTIEVQAPIIVFREWHRHRTQSYNEMSARYAPLPDINYIPTRERLFQTQKNNTQAKAMDGSLTLSDVNVNNWLANLEIFYQQAEALYQFGLSAGIPKEIARLCIPVGRYSRMRVSANLRNWIAFLTLRMHPNAQWEIQEYARAVSRIIEQEFPKTFQLFNQS